MNKYVCLVSVRLMKTNQAGDIIGYDDFEAGNEYELPDDFPMLSYFKPMEG